MSTTQIPQKPFDKIALSCSGGGYRAASFHLGTMAYLHRLKFKGAPLIERIKMISTVSGGTITGAVYALQKQKGKSFEEIFGFLMSRLHQLDLIRMGLEKLNPDGIWQNDFKRRNFINSFAELYDEYFTEGATFDAFSASKSHLNAIVFNSTDFSHGLNFRFRNIGPSYFGNKMVRVPAEQAREVKVADAVASSACFPGGFEPMIWPEDFRHGDAPILQRLSTSGETTGIMDGGIYDNQGIDSILTYKTKPNSKPYFDLIIVSDVSSPDMFPFQPFQNKSKSPFLQINLKTIQNVFKYTSRHINKFFAGLALIALWFPYSNGFPDTIWTGVCITVAAFSIIGILIKITLSLVLRKLHKWSGQYIRKIIPPFYVEKLSLLNFRELSVGSALPLIVDRANSLKILLSNVFLKIVRRLNYYKLYRNSNYEYRRVTNLIKKLCKEDFEKKSSGNNMAASFQHQSAISGSYRDLVSPKLQEVAESAASFGTTLWFTEEEQLDNMLDKLVASGQFTMCFNLIEYLESLMFQPNNGFNELSEVEQTAIKDLYQQCLKDWAQFNEDPLFLVRILNGFMQQEAPSK